MPHAGVDPRRHQAMLIHRLQSARPLSAQGDLRLPADKQRQGKDPRRQPGAPPRNRVVEASQPRSECVRGREQPDSQDDGRQDDGLRESRGAPLRGPSVTRADTPYPARQAQSLGAGEPDQIDDSRSKSGHMQDRFRRCAGLPSGPSGLRRARPEHSPRGRLGGLSWCSSRAHASPAHSRATRQARHLPSPPRPVAGRC